MKNCSFASPTKLEIGRDAENKTGRLIRERNGSRVLIHYGSGRVRESGLLGRVEESLREAGLTWVELGGVQPNPRLSKVYEGIELGRRERIDFILAVGGGSVIDSAKGIAMGIPYDGDVWDFYDAVNGKPKAVPAVSMPIGVVLTLAASGSEASNSSVLTREEGKLKRFCDNDLNRPVFAVENPELTFSLPAYQTACGIVDILSHSAERYFTCEKTGNPLTDRLCEAVFLTCLECGRTLMENPCDYEARAAVMLASSLSHNGLTGIGRTGDWATHMIEHELSGEYDLAHGAGLAMIMPAWMKYVYRENITLFLKFATRVMGVENDWEHPESVALEGIRRLEGFFESLGLPTRLGDTPLTTGIDGDMIVRMARRVRAAREDGSIGWLKRLKENDVAEIYRLAL